MYRNHIVGSLMVAVALMMAAVPASAMDAGQYAAGAGTKLGRGLVNTTTGWGEIPTQTVIGSKEDGVLGGVGGFFKGIGLSVARTLAGAFEIATFWAPVPERFEPVMQPATVFDWPTNRAFAKAGSPRGSQ
jgi:putative exosortase-associated protein (TIGR04073 family)